MGTGIADISKVKQERSSKVQAQQDAVAMDLRAHILPLPSLCSEGYFQSIHVRAWLPATCKTISVCLVWGVNSGQLPKKRSSLYRDLWSSLYL